MDKVAVIGIIGAVAGSLLTALTPKLRELVKKTDTKIDDIALEMVIKVNELFADSSNSSKKQRAKDLTTMALASEGIKNVSEAVLDKALEMGVTKAKLLEAESPSINGNDMAFLENVGVKAPVGK